MSNNSMTKDNLSCNAEEEETSNEGCKNEWQIDDGIIANEFKDLSLEEIQSKKGLVQELKCSGNELFQVGEYTKAAKEYTSALQQCPPDFNQEKSVLYANRAACFLYMEKPKEGIADCTKSLEINPLYLKALLRRAILYEKDDKLDEALEDYKKVLEMDPKNSKAIEACMRLPSMINERNEKLKTEMMSKLKDLGNMVLRPFGLSTDNFNVQKDPNTGSYSINFQQDK